MQKQDTPENHAVQPVNTESGETSGGCTSGKSSRKQTPNRPWVAVGSSTTNCAPKIGRSEDDGILFKISVHIEGRTYATLIDSRASRCYASPIVVNTWELQYTPKLVHLELVDSSKIRSTQKVQGVMCTVGQTICHEYFIVTKLLHGVDIVLGMT